jgi:hypothetical protein
VMQAAFLALIQAWCVVSVQFRANVWSACQLNSYWQQRRRSTERL